MLPFFTSGCPGAKSLICPLLPPPPPTSLPKLRLAWPCGRCPSPPCPAGLSFTGVGRNAIGLTSVALLVMLGTPPMGVMFGGGCPTRLVSAGIMVGGDGVAKEREAELSEAKESWPESHILPLHCKFTCAAARWARTSSPRDLLGLTGTLTGTARCRAAAAGTNSFPTLHSPQTHFLTKFTFSTSGSAPHIRLRGCYC